MLRFDGVDDTTVPVQENTGVVRLFDEGKPRPVRAEPGIFLEELRLAQTHEGRNFCDFFRTDFDIPGPPAAGRATLALPVSMGRGSFVSHATGRGGDFRDKTGFGAACP